MSRSPGRAAASTELDEEQGGLGDLGGPQLVVGAAQRGGEVEPLSVGRRRAASAPSGWSSRPSAMPAPWLPWPGKQSAARVMRPAIAGARAAPRGSLGDDDLAAVVLAAVGADAVRQPRLTALRARVQRRDVEAVMGAAHVAPAL